MDLFIKETPTPVTLRTDDFDAPDIIDTDVYGEPLKGLPYRACSVLVSDG